MVRFWKRFAAWGIASLTRYRDDPFFRTEVNVVSLQIAFALTVVTMVGVSFSLLDRNINTAIEQGISSGLQVPSDGARASATLVEIIVNETQKIRTQNLTMLMVLILALTLFFAYFVARITLLPARNALASQKQFIGNVAHELRTPLSIIKTNTEVALLGTDVNADMKSTLISNIEELDRVSEIINNLLSLSALVHPERMEFTATDISELSSDVIEKYASLARRNNVQITIRKSNDAVVWGNSTALQQIMGNLLKNAIIYTPRGGHVAVTIEPAINNHIEFTVKDSGIGIERKDLFRIFEPFYRADPSRVRVHTGSGLGLTIVSELVKLHQGKISVRSSVGRGTSVTVLLPAVRKHASVGGKELKEEHSEIAIDFSERKA